MRDLKSKPITFHGRTLSISDWARELGMETETLGTRLRRGWSLERALTRAVSHEQDLSFAAECRRHGLLDTTVRERIRRGWSLERALTTPDGARRRMRAAVLRKIADDLGLKNSNAINMRVRGGMDADNVLTLSKSECQKTRGAYCAKMLTFRSRTMSLSAWDRHLGLSHGTVRRRIWNGWPARRALTEAPFTGKNQFSRAA